MLTERQEKLLNFLIKEYISTAEPVGSLALKKVTDLDISAATIRNDCQELTRQGYIKQPHTSAGRIPTKKAYKYFAEKVAEEQESGFEDFIVRQIKEAHRQIEQEMKLAEELIKSLSETSMTLKISGISEKDNLFEILTILSSSKITYGKDIHGINEIIKKLENF